MMQKLDNCHLPGITRMYLSGVDGGDIARAYGVAKNTIYVALSRFGVQRHRGRIAWASGVRTCWSCGQEKPFEQFPIRTGSSPLSSRAYLCKPCGSLKTTSGLTQFEYNALLLQQDGGCALCHSVHRRLMVDHDHKSGEIRGLLCNRCNRRMAAVDESAWLAAAIRYKQSKTGFFYRRPRGPWSKPVS